MPFLIARSFILLSASTVAQLGSLPRPCSDPGYPQIFFTPYRARYFKCPSFVGALWHPRFISTGFAAVAAGIAANAADPTAPRPIVSAATPEAERNSRRFTEFLIPILS